MYNKNVVFICVGVAMMLTGVLYARSPIYLAGLFKSLIGDTAFTIWCGAMVWCGFGLAINPRRVLLWLLPLLAFAIPLLALLERAMLGLQGGSYTAILFYSIIPIAVLYMYVVEYTDQAPLFEIRYIIGILHVLMFTSLVISPKGAGLATLYDAIQPFMPVDYAPVLFYRNLYLVSSTALFAPVLAYLFNRVTKLQLPYPEKRIAMRLSVSPFIVHGLTFCFIIAFDSYAWNLFPFLFVVPICLFIMMRVYPYD